MRVQIVYQNADFLVIDKPAGTLVHPISREAMAKEKTLAHWLVKNFPQSKIVGDKPELRPGIVHRLDRNTSGLLVFALSQESFLYFKKLFQGHRVKKTYLALVLGKIAREGKIDLPIGLKEKTTRRTTHLGKAKLVKKAITLYNPIKAFHYRDEWFSLIEVKILTGRTHQIRVHLNSLHHPVIGDRVYGGKADYFGLERPFLHSFSLEFSFKEVRYKFESDLPSDLKKVLTKLETGNKI